MICLYSIDLIPRCLYVLLIGETLCCPAHCQSDFAGGLVDHSFYCFLSSTRFMVTWPKGCYFIEDTGIAAVYVVFCMTAGHYTFYYIGRGVLMGLDYAEPDSGMVIFDRMLCNPMSGGQIGWTVHGRPI